MWGVGRNGLSVLLCRCTLAISCQRPTVLVLHACNILFPHLP